MHKWTHKAGAIIEGVAVKRELGSPLSFTVFLILFYYSFSLVLGVIKTND